MWQHASFQSDFSLTPLDVPGNCQPFPLVRYVVRKRLANAIPRQKVVVNMSTFDRAIIAPLLVGVILLMVDHWLDGHK